MERREFLRSKQWLAVALYAMTFPMQMLAQHDLIIFRDGTERKVKIAMVTNDNTTFIEGDKKSSRQETVDNKSIYLIKYEKRGNMFFTDEGKRFSGEGDGKIPSGASVIYLLEGNEVPAYNVTIEGGSVMFFNSKKKGSPQLSVGSDKVFLIKYPDGTRDLMNDFEEIKRKQAEAEVERLRQEEAARQEEMRNQYPKDASIWTQKNQEFGIILLSEDDEEICYQKKGMKNSPVFRMKRANIKEITYNN